METEKEQAPLGADCRFTWSRANCSTTEW